MAQKAVKKKYKLRKGRVAMAVVIVVTLLAGIAAGIVAIFDRNGGGKKQTVEPVNPVQVEPNGEYVLIDMDDCNMYVGNILRLKCVSQPEEYADKVIWRSSNEDVVSVNGTGDIIVKSVGTAAITATYGTLSDSVIIKAVDRERPSADSGLPVFDVSGEGEIVVVETAALPEGTAGAVAPDVPTENSSRETTAYAGDSDENITGSPDEEGDGQNESVTESNHPVETEAYPEETSVYSDDVASAVINAGFRSYVGDTYIFTEDNNYLGEVIVGPDYVQIYVMTRTSSFDDALKKVMMSVMPDGYEDVFARFVSSSRNETLNVDGHMVRIIAPSGGGHSQIIIYY